MKKNLILLFFSFALILLVACQNENLSDEKTVSSASEMQLSDVCRFPLDEIIEIDVVDGTSGETTSISNENEIKNFISELERMKLKEIHLEDKIEGYLWMVRLKSNEEEFQLTSYSMGDRYFEENPDFDNIASNYFKN